MAFLLTAALPLLAGVTLIFILRLYALTRNYLTARHLSIPLIVRLESWQDPLWMLLGPSLRPLISLLGLFDPHAPDYTHIGWTQTDRFASHARHGPAFAIVTPFKTNIMIADVGVARELFKNWRTWVKDEEGLYAMFNAYGRNVNSVNGEEWVRHRKVTAPAFKEANSKLVWKATRRQVGSAVASWAGRGEENEISLRELRRDTEKVAMHVLMSAAFGKEYKFETGVKVVEEGHRVSFGEAMHKCIGSMAMALTPITYAAAKLPEMLIPVGLKKLQVAVEEVRRFLREAVQAERDALANGMAPRDNLISTLVRANEEEKKGEVGKRWPLTDSELYGNLFIFTMAGHETTSASLSYAIPLLAVYPEIQKWIRAEVEEVAAEIGLDDYTEAFPRLVRTLALMYETQRFFSAIPMLPKYTGSTPQILNLNGTDTVIPPKTFLSINFNAIHFDPAVWGSDVNDFRPSRWIRTPGEPGNEKFATPDGAEFVGWSSGPRICPGKRFSQVEFVAAVSRLVRECEVQPARKKGESIEEAAGRLRGKAFGVEHFISLQIKDPDAAGIVCRRRSD